jgi:outer membrane protein OmpA-like peptidoglycan-associated protein
MRFILHVILLVSSLAAVAQDPKIVKKLVQTGHTYFEQEQFHLAIRNYKEVVRLQVADTRVDYQLAESFRKTFNYQNAETYYLKVVYADLEQFPLALYYYALMLKLNGNVDESIERFGEFIGRFEGSDTLREFVDQAFIEKSGSEMAKTQQMDSALSYKKLRLPHPVNSVHNDFAPASLDSNTLVISSGRIQSNRQLIDERFGEAFTDNFYFKKNQSTWLEMTKPYFSITNSNFNDGSGSFTRKGDRYYYTVCGDGGPQCKIVVARFENEKWSEPSVLNENINTGTYEAKQPGISPGGDTLFFVSNRPGGLGQYDIWYSINSENDNWGPAINAGPGINTKLNELSPAPTAFRNILFFSSEGHTGFGGFDLYMHKRLSSGDSLLFNLGYPVNSSRDDCFISFEKKKVYWSSNRTEGLGGFDIYAQPIPSVISFISKITIANKNSRRDQKLKSRTEGIQQMNLLISKNEESIDYNSLAYEKKKIVDKMVENKALNTPSRLENFPGITAAEFALLSQISEDRFTELSVRQRYSTTILMHLRSLEDSTKMISITGILTDSLTHRLLTSVKIFLTDETGEVLKETRTNEHGAFLFTEVPASKKLYLRHDLPANILKPIVNNLEMKSTTKYGQVFVENIYFDFNQYQIRPEASLVLNNLASYLIHHPGSQVEIFAFADDRGTNEYNIALSQKRGQAVVEYLTQKGVDETGLAITAKGKQAARSGVNEVERQFNRRVEFYLNGDTHGFGNPAHTYILRKPTDWSILSRETGVDLEELKTLNGATTDGTLKAFQPVRLPMNLKEVSPELFFKGTFTLNQP